MLRDFDVRVNLKLLVWECLEKWDLKKIIENIK